MKYCNQQKNEKPLNAQRDKDRERDRERERGREATTVGCWLLAVACWLTG